ncbi:uncharacterized protein LOC113495409 [Trichoplusia ni]|uniref:Uncharacterized protein LOC113495409 n=1 Tax=Trichoplusia ni TaxID=7111 RepID=A0A7E5VP19_TRINI|nr:uncharacterized protein LOC113495409 [Trichoplusia ni]
MINAVGKVCLLCLLCDVMGPVSSLPLNPLISDAHYKVRTKRSPNNFSLFGYQLPFAVPDPSEKVTEAISSFRNIFVTERKHTDTPAAGAFTDIKNMNNKKHNESHIMSLVDEQKTIKMLEEIKPIRISNHNFSEYHIDKKLIDDIFKDLMTDNTQSDNLNNIVQENSDKIIEQQLKRIMKFTRHNNSRQEEIQTTTDPIETDTTDVTDTDEYETTTNDDFYRIDSSVLASLLG